MVVIKNLSRKYPNKYEDLDTLDKLESRASMIWFIGEYAEMIDKTDGLLASCMDNFHDENIQVQLQHLISIVKQFLKRPTDTQELVQQVCS